MRRNYLKYFDPRPAKLIGKISRAADRQGLRAYLVGGIVRDIILGRKNLDIDIVVEPNAVARSPEGHGLQSIDEWQKPSGSGFPGPSFGRSRTGRPLGSTFAQQIAKTLGAGVTVYREFGTATMVWPSGLSVDFAGARKEFYPRSGALPRVGPGTLRDDLFRRDFTINAMAIGLNGKCRGELIDESGGLSDLKNKKIRVLHQRSFIDDPTRILRAIRFEQRLHFRIEPRTLALLKEALYKKVFDNVHPSRYFTEFKKILGEDDPALSLKRLKSLGALVIIDPALTIDFRCLAQVQGHLKRLPEDSTHNPWIILLMAITATLKRPALEAFLHKFPFRTEEREGLRQAAGSRDILRKMAAARLSRSEVCRILRPLHRDAVIYLRMRASQKKIASRIDRYLLYDAALKADINGEDLKRLGIKPGREMGKILAKILDMKIDGRAVDKKAQLRAVQALLEDRGENDGSY